MMMIKGPALHDGLLKWTCLDRKVCNSPGQVAQSEMV